VPLVKTMYSRLRVCVIAYCGPVTRRRTTPSALSPANRMAPPARPATTLGSSLLSSSWICAALMYGDGSRYGGTRSCPGFIGWPGCHPSYVCARTTPTPTALHIASERTNRFIRNPPSVLLTELGYHFTACCT